jgi:hypothetical protein
MKYDLAYTRKIATFLTLKHAFVNQQVANNWVPASNFFGVSPYKIGEKTLVLMDRLRRAYPYILILYGLLSVLLLIGFTLSPPLSIAPRESHSPAIKTPLLLKSQAASLIQKR